MLDSRQQTILEILLNRSDYITIKELSKLTKVSERTVRYDIEKLNVFLSENGVKTIEKKSGKGLKRT